MGKRRDITVDMAVVHAESKEERIRRIVYDEVHMLFNDRDDDSPSRILERQLHEDIHGETMDNDSGHHGGSDVGE